MPFQSTDGPAIKPRPVICSLSRSVLARSTSLMRVQEQQRKAAKYEAMIHRFQVRRVDESTSVPTSRFSSTRLVIDKQMRGGRASWRKRSRRPSLRRLTRQLHHSFVQPSGLFQPLLPESRAATLHGLVMIAAFYFQVFYFPFAPSFFSSGSSTTTAIDVTLEVLAVVDIAMNFNTAFAVKRGVAVTSRRRIARRYLRSWLLFDAVAAFPLQTLRLALGVSTSTWHPLIVHNTPMVLMRLVRLNLRGNAHQVSGRLTHWVRYSKFSHLLGIARLLWLVLVIAHYMACFWHQLSSHHGVSDLSIGEQYAANYYYAVILIHGQGDLSPDWVCNLFSTVAVLTGSVVVATVFGNVAMLVSNFNASATTYQRKMEGVFATMDKMELPDRLRDRIQQYYAHVWAEYESLDGDLVRFQRELTHTLGLEVGLFKYMGLVNDIPFWADCSPDFIAQIVTSLVVRVYLPDDFVVRQGEVCSDMFMVNRGVCEMSSHDSDLSGQSFVRTEEAGDGDDDVNWAVAIGSGSRLGSMNNLRLAMPDQADASVGTGRTPRDSLAMLPPGSAFGEMSLLMNHKQPRSIRATTFIEMCVLERAAFQRILSRYPADQRRTLTAMLRSCVQAADAPLAWRQVCKAEVLRRDPEADAAAVVDGMTPGEAAAMLVEIIDVQVPDETITFGFHDGHAAGRRGSSRPAGQQVTRSEVVDGDGVSRLVLDKLDALADAVRRLEARQPPETECTCSKTRTRVASSRREIASMTSRVGPAKTQGADYERLHRLFDSHREQPTPLASVLTSGGERQPDAQPIVDSPAPRRLPPLVVDPPPSAGEAETPALVARSSASVAPVESDWPGHEELATEEVDQVNHSLQTSKTKTFTVTPLVSTGSRRQRVSLGEEAITPISNQLARRFLSSRMSNPSTERGTTWGLTLSNRRDRTQEDPTLADQLYQRRRRRSRNVTAAGD